MNLVKQLEPFNSHLDHFKAGYGITDTVAIQKLADIWDDFADTRKKEIYGSADAVIPRTKTTCASCIKDMMNMLCNWREIVRREEGAKLVDFKAVKKANVKEVKPPTTDTDPNEMDLIKAELTAKGIKFHQRHGLAKLRELNG